MRRKVCDVGVVVSGLLSRSGAPAELIDHWRDARFDYVVSSAWLAELDRVVARPKLARYIDADDAAELRAALVHQAVLVDDLPVRAGLTPDPGDDYLVALARASGADSLVSGDHHLLDLVDPQPPVVTPRAFVDALPKPRR